MKRFQGSYHFEKLRQHHSVNINPMNAYLHRAKLKVLRLLAEGWRMATDNIPSARPITQHMPQKLMDKVWGLLGGGLSLHHFSSGRGTQWLSSISYKQVFRWLCTPELAKGNGRFIFVLQHICVLSYKPKHFWYNYTWPHSEKLTKSP